MHVCWRFVGRFLKDIKAGQKGTDKGVSKRMDMIPGVQNVHGCLYASEMAMAKLEALGIERLSGEVVDEAEVDSSEYDYGREDVRRIKENGESKEYERSDSENSMMMSCVRI